MKNLSLSILALSLTLISTSAQAAVFNVNGTDYDMTTIDGSYNELFSQLSNQVWFNDENLAQDFAATVQLSLGDPYPNSDGSFLGILFANANSRVSLFKNTDKTTLSASISSINEYTWAIAEKVDTEINQGQSVPEPLTILGAGTAILFGTRFKQKLNQSKTKKQKN